MTDSWKRWRFSLLALALSAGLGVYTLWVNNPLHESVEPQPQFNTEASTPAGAASQALPPGQQAKEPLTLYQWDRLNQLRVTTTGMKARYRQDAPAAERWQVQDQFRTLSEMDQVLLDNTLNQLRTLNVRRLVLEAPRAHQLTAFGLDPVAGSTELILQGQKNGQPTQERVVIGQATPTGSGYYFFLPRLNQVYLGYVNIPEALKHLLEQPAEAS